MQKSTTSSELSAESNLALNPLANQIMDKAIENVTRKLIAQKRNKSSAADKPATPSAQTYMDVANRGVLWKEIAMKTMTHGISSLSTAQFDGEFRIHGGKPEGLEKVPEAPGVYVVYDNNDNPVYVGDSTTLRTRWQNGHLRENATGTPEKQYKLNQVLEEGCTVRFLQTDSEASAAAIEAHLIKEGNPSLNKRSELEGKQTKRSNIEAKKAKDHMKDAGALAVGAGKEALKQGAAVLFEQLASELIKALKDELVEVIAGIKRTIKERARRIWVRIVKILKQMFSAPFKALKGVFEFVVNALNKAFQQVYMLARNIFDLASASWNLFRGSSKMSREELVRKITETIAISGALIVWDALDAAMESQLTALGPVAPFLSATFAAIGFGLTSYFLTTHLPKVIDFVAGIKLGWKEAQEAERRAVEQLLDVAKREMELLLGVKEYVDSATDFCIDLKDKTQSLRDHKSIAPIDVNALLNGSSTPKNIA
ncbi:putative endonuclease [Idiomarina sp. A28L]|uniref:GIY-YIG nuclease family protein n=1 Tax=Idiomarina sp. A28L TaxID=1036674 RepID=UPI0002138A70|nr:GIY-YIG nuclease family protein [Idiomarina sp. A28L]EGN75879.1 putative endonuclease [Idiomarina sp. A28L]